MEARKGMSYWEMIKYRIKGSSLLLLLTVVATWFAITGLLGTAMWIQQGFKHSWLVYFYNAFTIFSNLNDDLGLSMTKQGDGGNFLINIPMMIISFLLIISGMIGIAVLSALTTKELFKDDETRFDNILDEFRSLAVSVTSMHNADSGRGAHRILNGIITRIHNCIMPFRSNTSINQLNVYEFEYILVNIINSIIKNCGMAKHRDEYYNVYDLQIIRDVINWAEELDCLYPHISGVSHSPIAVEFKNAWHNFSVWLPSRVREAQTGGHHSRKVLAIHEMAHVNDGQANYKAG